MVPPIALIVHFFAVLFRPRLALAAENIALRHQLVVLRREHTGRLRLRVWDRALWGQVLLRWRGWKEALILVRPETVVAWHRRGFRLFWRIRSRLGRPTLRAEIRSLIRRMAAENLLWGAARIHGELLKLGYRVSERSVFRYLVRLRPAPMRRETQRWATFLRNQAKGLVAVDMFTIPTVRFQILYAFVILSLDRRRIVGFNVTSNPTASWLSQQIRNAFPWDSAPRFLIHDRDGAFGHEFGRTLRGMGIREIRTAPRTPNMNAHVERWIGTARRECFDHVIIWNEEHARRVLVDFVAYYNGDRPHLSLGKDAPDGRPVESGPGEVVSLPRVGGLHHRYTRLAA